MPGHFIPDVRGRKSCSSRTHGSYRAVPDDDRLPAIMKGSLQWSNKVVGTILMQETKSPLSEGIWLLGRTVRGVGR